MAISPETLERWENERDWLRIQRADNNLYRNGQPIREDLVASYTNVAPKQKEPVKAMPPAEPVERIITCTPQVAQDPMTVLVVGAGGNGARIVPPLTQMLRRRDRLFIMDHDIVEDRNLARQHFTTRDIGQPKALVLAQRYQKRDLMPTALIHQITRPNLVSTISEMEWPGPRNQLMILGCVDNNDARGVLNSLFAENINISNRISSVGYIDVGNERRGGQVLLSLRSWPLLVQELGAPVPMPGHYSMAGLNEAMPQLCKPTPWVCDGCATRNEHIRTTCSNCQAAPGSCGTRIDLQTVMVNHMAAGMVLNCLSWLMLGLPFSSAGAFFSTLNTVQPIKIKSVDRDRAKIHVDTSFAEV